MSKYEKLRQNIVDYLSTLFEQYLIEPTSFPFYEIFFFDDISIQNYIVGTHRAAIHTALNDPYYYLQVNDYMLVIIEHPLKIYNFSVIVAKYLTLPQLNL